MKNASKLGLAVMMAALALPLNAAPKSKADDKKAAMDQMMADAMKRGAANEHHAVFSSMVGSWSAAVKARMAPKDKFQESKGISENTLILGGRFLRQTFKGDWAGQPFEGEGTTGYDNVTGQYESLWMDNFMTGIMKGTGTYDTATKTLKYGGTFSCPMTNQATQWFRSEWKTVDNDTNLYTSYSKDEKGQEFQSMEITFKRVK